MCRPFSRSAAIAVFGAHLVSVQGATQEEKIVPVHEEPRHHLVFDSPEMRIVDVQIPPGDTTLFHTHTDPILYVTMSTSVTRSQVLGREWSGGEAVAASPRRIGRMSSTTSYAKQSLTHRLHNVGQTFFRLIGITNATAGDESTTPSAGFGAQPEVDNPWFRGYRWKLTAASTKDHRHVNPVAIVLVSGRAAATGTSKTALERPGAFAWFEPNSPHRLQALGGGDAEVVEVEVRRPR